MATDWLDRIEEEVDRLRQTRDELRVQAHLGAVEVKDRWARLEKSWHELEAHAKRVGAAAHDASDDVEEATRQLVDELKHGYEKIRSAL